MKFHFKQALEQANYLQSTPEGKAETLLRETINVIKTIRISCIAEICFRLVSEGSEEHPGPYTIYSSYVAKTSRSANKLYCLNPIYDYDEAISIFQIIENKLKAEGFELEDDTFETYYKKSFKFKI